MVAKKILIVGSQNNTVKTLRAFLEERGYDSVLSAAPTDVLADIKRISPDIIVIDRPNDTDAFTNIMAPIVNDKEARFIPKMVMLLHEDIVPALRRYEDAIDDYIEKPIDYKILVSRLKVLEKWLSFVRGCHPITGLPGRKGISDAVKKNLRSGKPLAFIYYKINGFDAYNEKYGFFEGDRVLMYLVNLIRKVTARFSDPENFIGHFENDWLISVASPEEAAEITKFATADFDTTSQGFYTAADRQLGRLEVKTASGRTISDLMTLTMYVATNEKRKYSGLDDVMKVIAQLAKLPKKGNYSSAVMDRRSDKGTKFTVTKAKAERRVLSGKNRVLVIDRDMNTRSMIGNYLEMQGLDVITAGTISEAFSHAYEKKFDLIVTDVELPDGNGLEFLTRLKNIPSLANTPVMFLSSYANKELVIQAIRSGASRYLIKPINNPELYRTIYEVLVSK